MNTSDFEDRLLAELQDVLAATPAPVERPVTRTVRRRVLAGAAALAATAAGVAFALHTSPAYAVERDPDGAIRISVYDYRDPAGLQRRIESFGVRAAVDYIPEGEDCDPGRADFVPRADVPLAMVDWSPLGSEDHYFRVHPQYIGPDRTFVYTVHLSPHVQRASIRLAVGPVGPCDPS